MSLIYKEITDSEILLVYLNNFTKLVGITVPQEYFAANKVIGCFNKLGKLLGGYTIVISSPLRGYAILPQDVKANSPFLKQVSEKEMVEVNGLWVSKDINSLYHRAGFWVQLAKDVYRTRRKYLLLWYNKDIAYLHKLYQLAAPFTLYQGPAISNNGIQSHKNIYIGYVKLNFYSVCRPAFKAQIFYLKIFLRNFRILIFNKA